jgi:hypothetical protein
VRAGRPLRLPRARRRRAWGEPEPCNVTNECSHRQEPAQLEEFYPREPGVHPCAQQPCCKSGEANKGEGHQIPSRGNHQGWHNRRRTTMGRPAHTGATRSSPVRATPWATGGANAASCSTSELGALRAALIAPSCSLSEAEWPTPLRPRTSGPAGSTPRGCDLLRPPLLGARLPPWPTPPRSSRRDESRPHPNKPMTRCRRSPWRCGGPPWRSPPGQATWL